MEYITIYIMGKDYRVPKGLTIMKAMEETGYQFVRGAGCRGGFCGSCGTVFRTRDSYKTKVGLACQTVIEDGMYLAQLPFYPANKAIYDLKKLKPIGETLIALYPEVMRCISCNSCTKMCPQDIKVMDYVNAAIRGDIAKCADLSFNCIMCGLCATRCPAEIVQYYVGLLARRLYGAYVAKPAPHLKQRLAEMTEKKFDSEMQKLVTMNTDAIKELYNKRDIEK